MDPIHIDTISMGLSILYFKRLLVKISIKRCISVLEDCFILANSADPNEMRILLVYWRSMSDLSNSAS